jgi:hypothetical protein
VVSLLDPAWWPGGDLLSRALRRSTMGAEVFHGRVRDGIGCIILAMTTGPPGRILTDNRTDGGAWDLACVCWLGGVVRGLVLRAAGVDVRSDKHPGRCGVGVFWSSIGRLGPLGCMGCPTSTCGLST